MLAEARDGTATPEDVLKALKSAEVFLPKPAGDDASSPDQELRLPLMETAGGKEAVPLFSSLECLARAISEETAYLRVPFIALSETWPPSLDAVIDPGGPFELTISPAARDRGAGQAVSVPAEAHVFVGEPAEDPEPVLGSLRQLFSDEEAVEAAYRAQVFVEAPDEVPHLAVGVTLKPPMSEQEITALFDRGARAAAVVTAAPLSFLVVAPGQPGEDPVGSYMLNETEPFYRSG